MAIRKIVKTYKSFMVVPRNTFELNKKDSKKLKTGFKGFIQAKSHGFHLQKCLRTAKITAAEKTLR